MVVKLRAALYGRLSKEDKDKLKNGDDSASIVNQRLLLTEYAAEHGFDICGWYFDDDYSGLFSDRPGFEQLINDAKNKMFDVVIAKSQSRFTRNMEHMEKYLHTMFPILGIRFIGIVDNADTAVASNKKARQINGLINEWYCEDLSENIKSVLRAKMKDGQYIAAHPPYGYIKDPENKHHLIIDKYASEVVRRIYNMYICGVGKGTIAKQLSEEGILIPGVYKKEILKINYRNPNEPKNKNFWTAQTIHRILNDESYTGTLVQSKYSTISYKSKNKRKLPESEWIKIPGTHEAIIDKNTWETAKKMQQRKNRPLKIQNNTAEIFNGLIFCRDCGKPLAGIYDSETHKRNGYCCSTYKRLGKKYCSQHKILNDILESTVFNALKNEIKKTLTAYDISDLKKYAFAQSNDYLHTATQKQLQDKINYIEMHMKQAYDDYLDGLFEKDEYISVKNQYISEKKLYLSQKKLYDAEQKNSFQINLLESSVFDKGLSRELLVETINKIEVSENNSINIFFKFGTK